MEKALPRSGLVQNILATSDFLAQTQPCNLFQLLPDWSNWCSRDCKAMRAASISARRVSIPVDRRAPVWVKEGFGLIILKPRESNQKWFIPAEWVLLNFLIMFMCLIGRGEKNKAQNYHRTRIHQTQTKWNGRPRARPSVGSNAQSLELGRALARPQDKHHRVARSSGTGGS